ncbi:polysaccharide deacetylase family protein [Oscillibacter sp.]|jgi:peptidoglycan/xylan/chitin deacetylase (PgdA/CDA1 family)|uniref:polysaccharide deacetylase family protein n=1 Tax=Oscillibacter sp. TaxID=1945593 RepID=UPI00216CBED7|nr:polysaccharide deacetylase family protein [Oscillibacter sp.]MCI9241460.1 polysaccharide deacetylase family protein [Oscillibacter sp.]
MVKKIVPIFILALLTALCLPGGEAMPADGGAEIPAGEKYVALTFDDGPRRVTTERLLDGLKERGAKATFFLIGQQIEDNAALVARMAEEGHQIGNHTWSHQRLDGILPDEAAQEVARTEAALEALLGGGEYWLRPPYGQVAEGVELGVPMVKWCVDPRDWESRDAEKVTRAILDCVEPNSIILLHDIYSTSVDAALRVVDRLQEEGYWFVTVEELLWLNGVKPEAGRMYRTGKG